MYGHIISGDQSGQGEKEEISAQSIHRSRRQAAQAAFESEDACFKDRQAYEEV
jgi:hypothetical protein